MLTATLAAFWVVLRLLVGVLAFGVFVLVFGEDRMDDEEILHARMRGLALALALWFFLWMTA